MVSNNARSQKQIVNDLCDVFSTYSRKLLGATICTMMLLSFSAADQ